MFLSYPQLILTPTVTSIVRLRGRTGGPLHSTRSLQKDHFSKCQEGTEEPRTTSTHSGTAHADGTFDGAHEGWARPEPHPGARGGAGEGAGCHAETEETR